MLHKRLFPIAFRVVTFAVVSAFAAGCSNNGGAGITPPAGPLPTDAPAVTADAPAITAQSFASYTSAIMADHPTAYYHLGDTGTTAADASGNGLSGTIGSSVTKGVAGLLNGGAAMSFPGIASSNGIVRVPQTSMLQPSGSVSLETVLRFSYNPANYAVPIAYGTDRGFAPYDLYFLNGRLVAQFYLTSGVLTATSPTALAANTTYDVVSTFNGSTARLYLNGSLVASASKTGALTGYVRGYGLAIGDDAGLSDPAFKGTVDEVAVFANKALTQTQVSNHYAAATAGTVSSATPTPKPVAASPAPVSSTPAPVSATPKPSASPTSAPASSGNVAYYHGCPVFTAGDYYNNPVTSAAVDPNSSAMITSMNNGGAGTVGYANLNPNQQQVNLATSSTPTHRVSAPSWHQNEFPNPEPWQSGMYISPLSDGHAMTLNTSNCMVYEYYQATWNGSTLGAYSGWYYNLKQPMTNPSGNQPTANAAGLPLLAGMIKGEEMEGAAPYHINHALNIAPPVGSINCYTFVAPADNNGGSTGVCATGTYTVPYGAHLRLHSNVQLACGSSCPQAQAVLQALKTYGAFISDTGSRGTGLQLFYANDTNGHSPFNSSDINQLSNIRITDFDVLKSGSVCDRRNDPCVPGAPPVK